MNARRPSSLAFNELIEVLALARNMIADAERGEDASGDNAIAAQRTAILKTVRALIRFLHSELDPGELGPTGIRTLSDITLPLSRLMVALHDVERGGQPPLFFHRMARGPGPSRPTGGMRDYVRAHLASALQVLVDHGNMRVNEATTWVVNEAALAGLRTERGSRVTTGRLRRWRDEISAGTAPPVTRDQYEILRQQHLKHGDRFRSESEAKKRAQVMIWNIARLADSSAPGASGN